MKQLRQLCAATLLTLTLTLPTWAGQMETPFIPPKPNSVEQKFQADSVTTEETEATADVITEVELSIVQMLLSVLY